jgi:hypothetical protein
MRRALHADGEDVKQGRPLQALHDVKVNNVNSVTPVESLKDGLVGCEVCKLDEGGYVIEHLESAMNAFVVNQRRTNTCDNIN